VDAQDRRVRKLICDLHEAMAELTTETLWPMEDLDSAEEQAAHRSDMIKAAFKVRGLADKMAGVLQDEQEE
jgi:hypothetical protein